MSEHQAVEQSTESPAVEISEAPVVEQDTGAVIQAAKAAAAPQLDEYEEPVYTFDVEVGGETLNFESREAAVAHAKAETDGNERTAFLIRNDERLRMQFREGALFDYVLETRKGRSI